MRVIAMKIIEIIKTKKDIREYVKKIILSIDGNDKDIKRVIKEIKRRKCNTIEEVDSFLENIYI